MAQAQAIRTEAITAAQSLASIQTLLRAGLGCITYMRDLLPEDNFQESFFTSADDSICSEMSPMTPKTKKSVNPFKIMTITPGYTIEADKIINYLEKGIFDALQKQYLRSFILGIYLDSNEPTNIVEAYTFNFQYHVLPGSDSTIPVMTFGDGRSRSIDPVLASTRQGRVPTVRDVKRSVKTLLKTLIASMTQMDSLPKRRYLSMKLFYTDQTPSDYEPPHFHAGDFERDKWYLMTHDVDEAPDRWHIGKHDSGHHAVDVSIASIATYLPSSTVHDQAAFTGTTNSSLPSLTPTEHAALRAQQAAKQADDAYARNVVWAVEPEDLDGEGEDESDHIRLPDGSYLVHEAVSTVPLGIKNESGEIHPIQHPAPIMTTDDDGHAGTVHYGASSQPVPGHLDEALASTPLRTVDQTQSVSEEMHSPEPLQTSSTVINRATTLTPSPLSPLLDSSKPKETVLDDDDIETQLEKLVLHNIDTPEDSEMLDMETQIESIQSFAYESMEQAKAAQSRPQPIPSPSPIRVDADELECECGIAIHDEVMLCEGGCQRWYHLWCMGYHSSEDDRLPQKFICFDCRVKSDLSWELIKVDLYPTIVEKFKELALFRRAIKIAEMYGPGKNASEFAKKMGVDNGLARQLFKRLQIEEFIVEVTDMADEIGTKQTRSKTTAKSKGKTAKPRRTAPRASYTFNRKIRSTQAYQDYFNPDHTVESRLLGLPKAKPKPVRTIAPRITPSPLPPSSILDSQTQDNATFAASPPRPKRRVESFADSGDSDRPRKKKVKISVVHAVDLAE